MKILVTGATGFLGGKVLSELSMLYGSETVWGTGRNENLCLKLKKEGYNIIRGDLADSHFAASQLAGFTHVIHCAARAALWGDFEDFFRDNVVATRNIIERVASLQRIVFISTAGVYFDYTDRLKVAEESRLPVKFATPYAHTKYLAEEELVKSASRGVECIILRPRSIIGAGDTVIMPRVVEAYNRGKLFIVGDGKNLADFTSVTNLVHAIKLSLVSLPGKAGERFNITDGTEHLLWEVVRDALAGMGLDPVLRRFPAWTAMTIAFLAEMKALTGRNSTPVISRYNVSQVSRSLTLDISKARNQLGYQPVITTMQSIQQFSEWYREQTGSPGGR